jgi:demethylmenaquinone methyltransferase/2-methoxy-6-polyprenyl-1,4-benzoquinol methylase
MPERKKHYNEEHFTEAAARYDFATRAMSLGRDSAWKSLLVGELPEVEAPFCLDIACGTGDVTFLLAEKYPQGKIVGLDITEPMLKVARERNRYDNVTFTRQDMNTTDFSGEIADIVTGSYALRNAPDINVAIEEIYRILKPGGVGAFLDFSKSDSPVHQVFQCWLLKIWCGFWGLALHKNPEIHGYVAASLQAFPARPHFHKLLRDRGFEPIRSRRFYLGIVEITVIRKRGR